MSPKLLAVKVRVMVKTDSRCQVTSSFQRRVYKETLDSLGETGESEPVPISSSEKARHIVSVMLGHFRVCLARVNGVLWQRVWSCSEFHAVRCQPSSRSAAMLRRRLCQRKAIPQAFIRHVLQHQYCC